MLAWVPGIRRSCSIATFSDARGVQPGTEALFADGSSLPRLSGLSFGRQRDRKATESPPLFPQALFILGPATLILRLAEDPAAPRSFPEAPFGRPHRRHRTVLLAGS